MLQRLYFVSNKTEIKKCKVVNIKIILLAIMWQILFTDVFAQKSFYGYPTQLSGPKSEKFLKSLDSYEAYSFNIGELNAFVKDQAKFGNAKVTLNFGDYIWELALSPNELRSDDYFAEYVDNFGIERRLNVASETITFKGFINGNEDNTVRLTLLEDKIRGMFNVNNQTYFIESYPFKDNTKANGVLLYNSKSVIEKEESICISSSLESIKKNIGNTLEMSMAMSNSLGFDECYLMKIATEADYLFTNTFVNPVDANNELLSMVNMAEDAFTKDFNIKLSVVYQHYWSAQPSNYPYTTAYYQGLLNQFIDYWEANFSNIDRDAAIMMYGDGDNFFTDAGGTNVGVVGVAGGIGTICRLPQRAYHLQKKTNGTGAGDHVIFIHELGHNLGARHDDSFPPRNTSCDIFNGTGKVDWTPYMCRGLAFTGENSGWSIKSYEEISSHLNTYNSCINIQPECGIQCPSTINTNVDFQGYECGLRVAKGAIVASGVVFSGSDTRFSGGKIFLFPGFHVQEGAKFLANLDACNGFSRPRTSITNAGNFETKGGRVGSDYIYPNPINKNSKIKFKVNEKGPVSIDIIDDHGKPVLRLVENEFYNEGIHEISIKSENMEPGIYYFNINTRSSSTRGQLIISNDF